MTRSTLQLAMSRVDDTSTYAEERAAVADEGHRMLAEAEAAAEAEQAALAKLDADMESAAEAAATKSAETHADAVRVVIRAKAREGHDLAAMRPADAIAIDIIRRTLDGLRAASNVRIDDVFNAASTPSDIAKGAAVSKIIESSTA